MSLFDQLKNQAAQAARMAGNRAAQGLGQAASKAVANAGNKSYTVVFGQLPVNLAQMQTLPQADLTKPENTAALTIAALCMYPIDKEASMEMLNYLQGPKGLSGYDRQFLADRFRDKDYVPRSFFAGANPQNNYAIRRMESKPISGYSSAAAVPL